MSKSLEALKEYREKVKAGEIERAPAKDPIERWKENKKSLRFSINAKCWDCSCGQRNEIKLCSVKDCPLWYVRPYQEKTNVN